MLKDPGVPGWKGPYMDIGTNTVVKGLSDQWGTPLRYVISNGDAKVISAGRDKVFDTVDDLMTGSVK